MIKLFNLLKAPLILCFAIFLVWIFRQPLLELVMKLWNLPDADRSKLNDWLSIGGKFGAIGGVLWGMRNLFWQPEKVSGTPDGPALPVLTRDLIPLYYKALDEKCQALRLDIVATDLVERKLKLSLSDIYQDQHIRLTDEDKGQGRLAETSESIPLMKALEKVKNKRLVIRGTVGAGKSCFINYLAHCIISSHDAAADDLPREMLKCPVVRLLLRELGQHLGGDGQPKPGLLWELAKSEVEKLIVRELAEKGETCLQTGEFERFWNVFRTNFTKQGVLLLDGLDEVSEAENRRGNLRKAIEEFAVNAPQTFIIITGRPYAYETEKQRLAGFRQADLEPMTETQIREFIRHWFLKARLANSWDESEAEKRADELAGQIFSRPYLPEMASTAMLLTLFVGLDYSGKRLPSSRAKLYEEAVGLLLQRWNQNLKGYLPSIEEAERHGMEVLDKNYEDMLRSLKKLAYDTYEGLQPKTGQKEIPLLEFSHETVTGHLCGALAEYNQEHLLHFLQYRSALLVPGSGEDNFQFAHKSFHEYLAASHLLDLPNWKEKMDKLLHSNLEWWREVFLLLAKKHSDMQYGEAVLFLHHFLLRAYPDDDSTLPDEDLQRLLLLAATAGLELAVHTRQDDDLYKKFHRFLQTRLVALLHSPQLAVAERAEAGRLLGELGDPRPGVGCQKSNGKLIMHLRRDRRHALPDFDWQEIPEGTFRMGDDDEGAYSFEKPTHDVTVPRFFISRYPVTNAQFRCFIEAGLYEDMEFWHGKLPQAARLWLKGGAADEQLLASIPESSRENYRRWVQSDQNRTQPRFWADRQWNLDNHPVVGVSWYEALAYGVWLNELMAEIGPADQADGQRIRLPTEVEWEYAARGKAGWKYAWGSEADASKGNYADTELKRTCAVGLFQPDLAFGLHEMSGNVWEWTLSRWGNDFNKPNFAYDPDLWQRQEKERNLIEPVEFRITRGGSWDVRSGGVRCAFRGWYLPDLRNSLLGFRLVLGSPW